MLKHTPYGPADRRPIIFCLVCKKRVDRVQFERQEWSLETYIIAFCHGEKDSCVVDDLFVEKCWPDGLRYGTAFQPHGGLIERATPLLALSHPTTANTPGDSPDAAGEKP